MKRFLKTMLLLSFSTTIALAQEYPLNENGEAEFVEVVEVDLQQKTLYANAKEWVATTFGDYKSVIQFEDDENYKLILKGLSKVPYIGKIFDKEEKVGYIVTIECKDGKYRYRISDIVVNETRRVLGRVNSSKFTTLSHLEMIELWIARLEELNAVDASKLRKKERDTHYRKIKETESLIDDHQTFYTREYNVLISLIESLKNAMRVDNSF
jgi:hypothetical protein